MTNLDYFYKDMIMMNDERWYSPFPCTIPFVLFKKHFTELNANANSKKDNGLQLDIDNNKVKPATLVEEEDNSNNK